MTANVNATPSKSVDATDPASSPSASPQQKPTPAGVGNAPTVMASAAENSASKEGGMKKAIKSVGSSVSLFFTALGDFMSQMQPNYNDESESNDEHEPVVSTSSHSAPQAANAAPAAPSNNVQAASAAPAAPSIKVQDNYFSKDRTSTSAKDDSSESAQTDSILKANEAEENDKKVGSVTAENPPTAAQTPAVGNDQKAKSQEELDDIFVVDIPEQAEASSPAARAPSVAVSAVAVEASSPAPVEPVPSAAPLAANTSSVALGQPIPSAAPAANTSSVATVDQGKGSGSSLIASFFSAIRSKS